MNSQRRTTSKKRSSFDKIPNKVKAIRGKHIVHVSEIRPWSNDIYIGTTGYLNPTKYFLDKKQHVYIKKIAGNKEGIKYKVTGPVKLIKDDKSW